MKKKIHKLTLELVHGDITRQPDMDAITNAANAQLRTGGGVAGAIHRIADPDLEQETRPLAPISPGEAVITRAPHLPNLHIIHCLGPVYGHDEPSDELLSNCYRNALKLAEGHNLASVAFPALSTGAFGYPMREAAEVAMHTLREAAPDLGSLETVRFVLWGEDAMNIHMEVLDVL